MHAPVPHRRGRERRRYRLGAPRDPELAALPGCYSTARRTGNLRPLRTPVPETCNACGRAMGRKHGQVRHHTAGNCINCVRTGKVGAAA
ncbi:hypothetical protein GS502_11210 [Rhodococcus hoagii]|nr:hypothetical protein [Prescottella equi]